MEKRIAIVTGGNRGIGLEIVQQLAQTGEITVVLTARDETKGRKATEELSAEGLDVVFAPCDVTSAASIDALRQWIDKEYGRCDILVNNAGILPDARAEGDFSFVSVFDTSIDTMRAAIETNVYGPMLLCQAFVPMMKKNNYGRIVNVSSGMGQLCSMNGGFPAYRHSKTALNALTRIMSEELLEYNIKVNSLCPGWVHTDMGGSEAPRTPEEGADSGTWLATLPDDGPSGQFIRDRKPKEW